MTRRTTRGLRLAGAALALLLAGCAKPAPETQPRPGAPLPFLVLEALDGSALDSTGWRGHTVVLNLWATWCEPCRREMPSLDGLSRDLAAARVRVIGLALDDDRNLVREFALQYGIGFPLAMDPQGRIAQGRLGVRALPETLLIAPDGKLAERVLGGADWSETAMRQRVLRVAAGKADAPAGGVAWQGRP